ncbi:hypothetical protein BGZ59_009460 [Podila verticillata]|nr:hypothetical protein BGZ59_009460 [Podila verticillata]
MVTAIIPSASCSSSLPSSPYPDHLDQAGQQSPLPSDLTTTSVPGFNRLPTEIEIIIIRLLGPWELLKASETCKHWRRIITDAEWFRVCKQMLPRWSLGLEFDELRGDRPWQRYTMETYLRTKYHWRAPIQPSKTQVVSSSDLNTSSSTSSSSLIGSTTPSTSAGELSRAFLHVPRDQFLTFSTPLPAPNLAWQNIGPPIPHTHLATGETLVAFMQARYYNSEITHQIALYRKRDLTSPLAIIGNDVWCEPGPYGNRPWFWPFQAQQLQVAQVMDFSHYPDQQDMFGRVKMVFVIALGENSGPLGGTEGEMHVLDVWLTIKVLEVFVPMTSLFTPRAGNTAHQPTHPFPHFPPVSSPPHSRPSSRAGHSSSIASFEASIDNEVFRTAIETIVPYHHNREAIRGRMATTYIRNNEKTGEDEDWIAIFGIRHAAEGQAVFLTKSLFSDPQAHMYRQSRLSIIMQSKHQPQEHPNIYLNPKFVTSATQLAKPISSILATSQLQHAQPLAPISRTQSPLLSTTLSTSSVAATGENNAVQLSPPPGSQAVSQSSSQPLAPVPVSPNRPPFKDIVTGASCMSLFPANSDFEHLMVVVTAEGEGFIFDWIRNTHVARLSTATTTDEDIKIEREKKEKEASPTTAAAHTGIPFANTVLVEAATSPSPITAKDKNLYHWGVQVNWAVEEPDVAAAFGPRKRGNFRIVTMADGTNKEWQSSYWHVDEGILRGTTSTTLGKRPKNPVEDHQPLSPGLENKFLNLEMGSDELEESTDEEDFDVQPAAKVPRIRDEAEAEAEKRYRQAKKSAKSLGRMIGSCRAQVAVQVRRGESAKDVLAPGQHLIESATTFSQSDRDVAKTLPALLTKSRHFVMQTTGLSQESFQIVMVGVDRDSVNPFLLENPSAFKSKDDNISKNDLPDNVGDVSSSSSDLVPSSSPLAEVALRPDANAADKSLLFIAYLIWDHYRISLTSQYGLCLIDMDKEYMGDVQGTHQEWVTILPKSEDDPLVDIATIDDCLFITRKFSHEIWPFRRVLRKAGVF